MKTHIPIPRTREKAGIAFEDYARDIILQEMGSTSGGRL